MAGRPKRRKNCSCSAPRAANPARVPNHHLPLGTVVRFTHTPGKTGVIARQHDRDFYTVLIDGCVEERVRGRDLRLVNPTAKRAGTRKAAVVLTFNRVPGPAWAPEWYTATGHATRDYHVYLPKGALNYAVGYSTKGDPNRVLSTVHPREVLDFHAAERVARDHAGARARNPSFRLDERPYERKGKRLPARGKFAKAKGFHDSRSNAYYNVLGPEWGGKIATGDQFKDDAKSARSSIPAACRKGVKLQTRAQCVARGLDPARDSSWAFWESDGHGGQLPRR